jgi:hypothetical protein
MNLIRECLEFVCAEEVKKGARAAGQAGMDVENPTGLVLFHRKRLSERTLRMSKRVLASGDLSTSL